MDMVKPVICSVIHTGKTLAVTWIVRMLNCCNDIIHRNASTGDGKVKKAAPYALRKRTRLIKIFGIHY